MLQNGLRVRSRESYQDLSRTAEESYMVESALLFDDLPWSESLQVEIGKPYRKHRKRMIPLTVQVPIDQVTVLRVGRRYRAQLELRTVAMDSRGNRSEVDVIPFELFGTSTPEPGQTGSQTLDVRLRNTAHDLVISLHDPLSGKIFTTRLEVGR